MRGKKYFQVIGEMRIRDGEMQPHEEEEGGRGRGGRWEEVQNVGQVGKAKRGPWRRRREGGAAYRRRQWRRPVAAAGRQHVEIRDRGKGEAAVSAASTAAARGGAAAVAAAEAAVGLLP